MDNLIVPQGRFLPRLIHGDCLERMSEIDDESVDMILCDLPYGMTSCAWDSVIPLEKLWAHYERIIKQKGAIVLTASQPFTSALVMSNPQLFRHSWIWDKELHTNFHHAKHHPLKVHEDVLVFSKNPVNYFPVKTPGKTNHSRTAGKVSYRGFLGHSVKEPDQDMSGMKYPRSIQKFPKHPSQCGLHPTQKPVELMDYLIRTYSMPGDTVLDNCFGSCATGIAAYRLGRRFIGIEKDEEYYSIGADRMRREITELLAV